MRIQLSEHFTYKKLLCFSLPTIAMMIFTSIYGIVDGFFVSNYVGKTAFAAVNLIMPYLMIQGCFGFMIGTGGGALVAKTLGERKRETADRYFTMLVWFTVILGVLISVVSILIMRPVVLFLGAEGAMVRECMIYGVIMSAFNAAFMLQYFFQSFLWWRKNRIWDLASPWRQESRILCWMLCLSRYFTGAWPEPQLPL